MEEVRRQESGARIQRQKYADPIACPVCGKVLGEWVEVKGSVTIRKWCPRCKEFRFITKKA